MEYALANDLEPLQPTKKNYDAATQFLLKILLRDFSPPWATRTFFQALPRNGLLSRCTSLSFLRWDKPTGRKVFGDSVAEARLCITAGLGFEPQGCAASVCLHVHQQGGEPGMHVDC